VLDGFINYPRSIDGVEVAIQFYEQKPNSYKISFRSRGHVNVATIAECFAGGGHVNAAGCEIVGEFEEVQTVIYQAVEQALR
jgi:phosphoesterase RecJ-like protein